MYSFSQQTLSAWYILGTLQKQPAGASENVVNQGGQ